MSRSGRPDDDEDIREDDLEFDPTIEPKEAKAWLNLIRESEDVFEQWNDHCDKIDKRYASLDRLTNNARGKEYQMFWANAEVLKPSIYASPPVPVVVPKFLDRRPVYQAAAELLERCCVVAFDLAGIDELMKLVRDDVALADRGVAWCRYESGDKDSYYPYEKVCIDFKNRKDFLHTVARNWREVTWVAGASYLTRKEARERFRKYSGDEYRDADYRVDRDSKDVGGADARERAKFWEIWSKDDKRVVWVAEGCEKILDEDDPHLNLREFFPCPRPAYGTLQRGSLVPVPDVLQYKDQLEEIDLLTERIHALSDAIEAKGFYPAGGSEIADAVQQAISIKTPGRVLVPISNWAAFGGSKEVIVWLPMAEIAQTITGLVVLRKQIIDDIYQITGLADIMRGDTDPAETLGAQQLKTQYGSTRIRDKQQELVRFARDLVEITSEILTDKFSEVTLIEMSQTTLPDMKMVREQSQNIVMAIQQMQMQMQQAMQSMGPPQAGPQGGPPTATPGQGQQPPDQSDQQSQSAQMMQDRIQQATDALDHLKQTPTIDQVMEFLDDNKTKAFVLDIETDSTIIPDENAEKQQRTEFIGMLAQLLPQLAQMVTAEPKTSGFCGELLRFAVAPFRAGRSMDGAINELVELMKQKGQQPPGTDPTTAQNQTLIQVEQIKAQSQQQIEGQKMQLGQQELQMKDRHKQMELDNQRQMKMAELQAKQGSDMSKLGVQNQKAMESREAHQAEMLGKQQDMELQRRKAEADMQQKEAHAQQNMQHADQRNATQQFKMMQQPQPRRNPGGL